MGQCLNCLKSDSSHDNVCGTKCDEQIEIRTSDHVSAANVENIVSEQPLLQENVDSLVYPHSNKDAMMNAISHHGEQNYLDSLQVQKYQANHEKTSKLFYQKLQSIPLSLPSLASNEARVSDSKINVLFDQYKDSLEDAILAEGIENLCNDLQLNPDDFKVLVLAWKLNASQMCRFTRDEFIQGLKSMKTDSIKGIQQKLNDIICELKSDSEQFKDLYRFTFKFGLDVSSGQRILPSEIAIVLWRLVFTASQPPILEKWLNYLEKNPHVRGVPKDTWYMFLNFCEYVGEDLSCYDDTEAWPSLFDDFVEYENDQVNQNINKSNIKIED